MIEDENRIKPRCRLNKTGRRARRQPKAYEDTRFLRSRDARALRILAEYLEPLYRFERHNVQDTIVFMGSARLRSEEAARAALAEAERAGEGIEAAQMALAALDLLRGRARACPALDGLVEEARPRGAALRRLHRRRSRHHGGGQSRRLRGEGAQCRADHLDPGRGIRQPLYQPGPAFLLPLLLHAQVLVCLLGQSGRAVPGRLWHARRAVRDPDARCRRARRASACRSCSSAPSTGTR